VEDALRSSGLLCVEEGRARVSQFASKPAEVRRRVVHVAPLRRLREDQVEDERVDAMDYVRSFYPKIIVFYVLGPRAV
jgi:hypothetical protein